MARRDDAQRLADEVAHLLHSIPAEVWRAERQLTGGLAVTDAQHQLGALLTFHQDIGSPISEIFSYALPCARALRCIARYAGAHGVIEGRRKWPMGGVSSSCRNPDLRVG